MGQHRSRSVLGWRLGAGPVEEEDCRKCSISEIEGVFGKWKNREGFLFFLNLSLCSVFHT